MPVIYGVGPLWIKPVGEPDSQWRQISGNPVRIPEGEWLIDGATTFSPDESIGASVDDLIDNIDAVLASYRSDS